MKLVALALVALFAPGLAPPQHAADAANTDALPTGCRWEGALTVCQWNVDTSKDLSPSFKWSLPPAERTLAEVTIRFSGQDMGWTQDVFVERHHVSGALHSPPQGVAPDTLARQSADHLLLGNGTGNWTFVLTPGYLEEGSAQVPFVPARSAGTFAITYVAEQLPKGAAPLRPAATRDTPQLRDSPFDSAQGGTDITAVWFDDPAVGDGLFDAHFAVRDLGNLTFARSQDVRDYVSFTVKGEQYELLWHLAPSRSAGITLVRCWIIQYNGGNVVVLMDPACDVDVANSTLSATIPERVVGSPGPGELFTGLQAGANNLDCNAVGACSGNEDVASGERFAFALGGPDVWDGLNHCAFCPPKSTAAWWTDPLAPDNLPNTLQVVGAIVAIVSFIGGLIVLRKNRRQTRELLSRVDALAAMHERDAREAIHALAELEQDFTTLYRAGKINESQYQLATQRVVAAASRFALRRELGMESAVRVPVESGSAPLRVNE